ncbi:CDP-alcohol phosphatidyltransferase family protein [Candidatus Pseudothioglobus singularis]|jgi:phosphatidylglycerophosphate synthase|nr:CDP-alcohol phosphatidyltransferase family protein [Candidatus Pseudothioglobus singularis]
MNLYEMKKNMVNSYGEKKDEDQAELINYYFVRPISFWVASVFAVYKIRANTITWLSLAFGLIGVLLFFKGGHVSQIISSLLIFIWLILDCVDGNLARYYKTQSIFGDFLDSLVCYIVFAFLPISIAYSINNASLSSEVLFLLGWMYSIGFTLSRLIYQKFKQISNKKYKNFLSGGENASVKQKAFSFVNNIFNPSGFMVPFLVISAVFEWLEVYLIIYGVGYFFILIYSVSIFIYKARTI